MQAIPQCKATPQIPRPPLGENYLREVCSIKQMTKIFVFLDKDWEDRGTGPVYFILKSEGKYHKLNDFDMDRLHFNWNEFNRREQQKQALAKEVSEQVPVQGDVIRGKDLAGLNAAEVDGIQGEDNKQMGHEDVFDGQEYSVKIQSDPEEKLYEAYLEGDTTKDVIEEAGFIFVEPGLEEEVRQLNALGLGITFESTQKKPRTGELYILILKSDDNNLPKRPDCDLNEVLKGELHANEDILMWYNLSQIFTMDPPYNNIIEWQHKSPDKLKLAISFLSFPKCEESYHAILKNVGIQPDDTLSPIEPGCDLNQKLMNMKLDSVDLDSIKTAYMEPGSRYMRGLYREFCYSKYYNCHQRLEELGEIFKFFVFLSDMDIMTNMISDENHIMFFTCLNYLTENKDKGLDFEKFFREKAAMINVLNIKKEEIIVVINNRFRLIFLKDYVFSVSLNEEILQHYNIFLIMNGTTVISYLIDSMETLFSNLDELIHRNVDQMTNFFGEFFGTIKHHFIQFEELKIKFSAQMVTLGMWKKLSALILRNLSQLEKLNMYLDNVVSMESSFKVNTKSKFSEIELSNEPENKATLEKLMVASEKKVNIDKTVLNESMPLNMGSSFISVVSEVKSVRGEERAEAEITMSVRGERRKSRVKYKNREYLEKSLQKVRKKVLLCLEVLSFVIKHNKHSANQIFLEPVYKGKCLADGIYGLASFPFLSIRETFTEMFNFFIHYMDNKEHFIYFLFDQLYPYIQTILEKHKHKFEYFEPNGFEKYIEDLSSKNQIQAIKQDQMQSKEPYQQKLQGRGKKNSESILQEIYKEGLKKMTYKQYWEGPNLSSMRKMQNQTLKEREVEESAKSQEDFDRKSLRVEESLMSEYRSDFESIRKRGFNEFRGGSVHEKKRDIVKDTRRFERTKANFENFISFYLTIHDVMDKIGSNEVKYWERKESLFNDCKKGFLLINKKSIQIYFLKVLHEAVHKETFNASETLFDEPLLRKLFNFVHENLRKNSMMTCILKGIFHGLGEPSFKKVLGTLVDTYDKMLKESDGAKPKIWNQVKFLINEKKHEIEIMKNQQIEVINPIIEQKMGPELQQERGGMGKMTLNRRDCFIKKNGSIGKKNPIISDSLIGDEYLKDNFFSDEEKEDNVDPQNTNDMGPGLLTDSLENVNKQLFVDSLQIKNDKTKEEENGANSDELVLINLTKIQSRVNLKTNEKTKNNKLEDINQIQHIKLD
jgi:hypothetical protein